MISEVATAAKAIEAKIAEEGAKEIGKNVVKNGVDISKRLDVSKKSLDTQIGGVDITKRIDPNNMDLLKNKGDISVKQKKELLKNGMSPGILDKINYKDGVYQLKTNEEMAGKVHPDTNVAYEKKIVDLFGNKIEGVFPKFESQFSTKLPDNLLQAKDKEQFKYCNEQLKSEIKTNQSLREKFSPRQLEQISNGDKPSGFTWNHKENLGEMELVDTTKHSDTPHVGGKALWGGGSVNR